VQLQQLVVDSVFVFSGHFLMQVVTTTPQTSMGLRAIGPDMADKALAFVALRKASLSSV
jgi:hypothetical protein